MAVRVTTALTADVVATVSISGAQIGLEVVHVVGTDPVFFTIDGSTPTKGTGAEYLVVTGGALQIKTSSDTFDVKLISNTAATVHVAIVEG